MIYQNISINCGKGEWFVVYTPELCTGQTACLNKILRCQSKIDAQPHKADSNILIIFQKEVTPLNKQNDSYTTRRTVITLLRISYCFLRKTIILIKSKLIKNVTHLKKLNAGTSRKLINFGSVRACSFSSDSFRSLNIKQSLWMVHKIQKISIDVSPFDITCDIANQLLSLLNKNESFICFIFFCLLKSSNLIFIVYLSCSVSRVKK